MVRQIIPGYRQIAVAVITLVLGACTMGPPPRGPVAPVYSPAPPPAVVPETPPAPVPDSSDTGAVDSLLRQARQEAAAGRYGAAVSTTERAVRIAPHSPDAYEQLARLYAAHGDCARATQFAGKALSLSSDNGQRQRLLTFRRDCAAGYR